ncbi:hypothetical protein ASC75_19765 [Aminobacter sp. DSM 101952]|uniref:Uncharacterized protein n=3 Tax=Alphaproteobacteria TaxID=28211 RepID=A0A512HMN5_9HYPH|nr:MULTISPECIES: hypothetical protein [Alphaproteobacteria]KQU75102.1 hypothetical protein ASC75_19765 [Aminobacter sp. DSM 101952]KRA66683.1 hypothetical protein ASD85_24495 [Rhizobium sp. Root651]MBE0562629.1 hypothetical protein [Brucella anthropi]MDH2091822.1 hypothetical protein [Agrobacterium pusense]GEO86712.1 hypothetical protein RNA01_36440 [Ciceribacter naphthalenivorans]
MRQPPIMFRLPDHVLRNVDALAGRLDVSVNIVAKLIVTREIMHVPAMLEEHDRQMANMHQFLRELAWRNEAFLAQEVGHAEGTRLIAQKLDEVMGSIDAIRDAAFVRPSSYIVELIRKHDEQGLQKSLEV